MMKRRNPIFRNIWWLLAIVIIAGLGANYFFSGKNTSKIPAHHQQDENYHAGPLLDIQTWKTTRGLNVYFLPIDNLPIVDVQLIFNAGSAYDGSMPGLSSLTNQLIGKKTRSLTTDNITELFESQGALFSTQTTRDAATVTLRTLSFDNERQKATELFAQILADINFSADVVSLEKQQMLTGLAAQAQSPQAQSVKAFYAQIYGAHPYASPMLGTLESINAITLPQIQEFYTRYYNINNGIAVIVGDVTVEEAQQLAEKLDLALSIGEPAPAIPSVTLPAAQKIEHVNFPSSQEHILMGLPALETGNPDFFAFYVGNEILGGSGLSSQLFEVVREQEGLAYSIGSQINPLKQKGPFVISLQTRHDASDIALALVQEHLAEFIADGPNQQELEKAKQNISGQFLMAFNSNAAIAQNVAVLAFYHLPLDYFENYLEKIDSVTLDDIKRVFNDYVGSQHMTTITLGPSTDATPAENSAVPTTDTTEPAALPTNE